MVLKPSDVWLMGTHHSYTFTVQAEKENPHRMEGLEGTPNPAVNLIIAITQIIFVWYNMEDTPAMLSSGKKCLTWLHQAFRYEFSLQEIRGLEAQAEQHVKKQPGKSRKQELHGMISLVSSTSQKVNIIRNNKNKRRGKCARLKDI